MGLEKKLRIKVVGWGLYWEELVLTFERNREKGGFWIGRGDGGAEKWGDVISQVPKKETSQERGN